MDVNTYMQKQFEYCVNELSKQNQVYFINGVKYLSSLAMIAMYKKGFYQNKFETIQKTAERIQLKRNKYSGTIIYDNVLHRSLALMYTEN